MLRTDHHRPFVPPVDHLRATMHDRDYHRKNDAIERNKAMYRQARGVSTALRTSMERQPKGGLTRADGAILSLMILQNLRACVRRQLFYCPTRARLAKLSGYSERTVSRAIARLIKAGLIVVARYAKGGRHGRGKGIATEFRSGCLQFLVEQMATLGYRLPKTLRADLTGLAAWAAVQCGEEPQHSTDTPSPVTKMSTGTQCPTTILPSERAVPIQPVKAADPQSEAPSSADTADPPRTSRGRHPFHGICSGSHTANRLELVRAPMGRLASLAMQALTHRQEPATGNKLPERGRYLPPERPSPTEQSALEQAKPRGQCDNRKVLK